jgi:Tfp pilus assembly protein PilF
MNRTLESAVVVVFVIVSMATGLHSQSVAAYELNLGVQAFKEARYEEATQHFEKAVALAPENAVAHLYLATTFAQQYIRERTLQKI